MQGRVDGLLVMSPHADAAFSVRTLPHGVADGADQHARHAGQYATLYVDNYGGATAMMRHLFASGLRSIAFISGPDDNFDADERLRGFTTPSRARQAQRRTVLRGDFTEESGYRAGHRVCAKRRSRPRAIFAANDMMALGCLFALTEKGVRVPDDIALAGFDDIPIARFVTPPLTTVRVRIADLGRRAFERLVLQLDMPDAKSPPSRNSSCDLVVRASSGGNDHSTSRPTPAEARGARLTTETFLQKSILGRRVMQKAVTVAKETARMLSAPAGLPSRSARLSDWRKAPARPCAAMRRRRRDHREERATGSSAASPRRSEGSYTLAALPPGTYTVDAGRRRTQTVTLTVAQTAELDLGCTRRRRTVPRRRSKASPSPATRCRK